MAFAEASATQLGCILLQQTHRKTLISRVDLQGLWWRVKSVVISAFHRDSAFYTAEPLTCWWLSNGGEDHLFIMTLCCVDLGVTAGFQSVRFIVIQAESLSPDHRNNIIHKILLINSFTSAMCPTVKQQGSGSGLNYVQGNRGNISFDASILLIIRIRAQPE